MPKVDSKSLCNTRNNLKDKVAPTI